MSLARDAAEERALLAAIRSSPEDGPRLVYADWLLERGDPRGELIHVQCRLAASASAELLARENELLQEHMTTWFGVPHDPRVVWSFDRGFPTGMFGHTGLFAQIGRIHSIYARFFPDGVVALLEGRDIQPVDAAARLTHEYPSRVMRGLGHSETKGATYTVWFSRGAPPVVRFRWIVAEYSGTIHGPRIDLEGQEWGKGQRPTAFVLSWTAADGDSRPTRSVRPASRV